MSLESKVVDCGRRIARLLAVDVEVFVPTLVRERFGEHPTLARTLDDAGLIGLKTRALALAESLAGAVEVRLAEPSVWLDARPTEGPASTPLTEHPPVAATVAHVEAALDAFLQAEALASPGPVVWRLPMRFIDGENLGTLTQSFWKAVARLSKARSEEDARKAAETAEARLRRWDDA
jgi:hypothetical protein